MDSDQGVVFVPHPSNPRFIDMAGRVFGRLTVIGFAGSFGKRKRWFCRCECGSVQIIEASNLLNKTTQSCGCLHRERSSRAHRRHRLSQTPEYYAWNAMRVRCSSPVIQNYGAKGIRVCNRWQDDFVAFLNDMGRKPTPGHSLERLDGSRGYEPGNCVWATIFEQNRNTSRNHLLTFNGVTKTMTEWARDRGLATDALRGRLRIGWPLERALTEPPHRIRSQKSADTTRRLDPEPSVPAGRACE
jgi:hypothetical protein